MQQPEITYNTKDKIKRSTSKTSFLLAVNAQIELSTKNAQTTEKEKNDVKDNHWEVANEFLKHSQGIAGFGGRMSCDLTWYAII